MSRYVYVNGRFAPYAAAAVHVEDRGFQFGDAVYEVCPVDDGRIVDEGRHLARLGRSMAEIGIAPPMAMTALGVVMRETVRRNRVRSGFVYLQVSRGTARRDFPFPPPATPRTVVCLARSLPLASADEKAKRGVSVRTMPDRRWGRPDIKSVQLLWPVLAKQAAKETGDAEAWLVDVQGRVTEGASSNAWIVTREGVLVTRAADDGILRGVTRSVLIDLLAREGIAFEERPFSVAEAKAAREAFLTSATNIVIPIVAIDGTPVGDGKPGPVSRSLRTLFPSAAEYTRAVW